MKKFVLVCLLLPFLISTASLAQNQPKILIVYYSAKGHTRSMAEAAANGARSMQGVNVKLLTVAEARTSDVIAADAIIVGSPVYNANVAPPVQEFINSWPFSGAPLRDKIGAAFVSGGGISAGEELTQMNILHSMLIFGMIVAGGPDWKKPFGASAIVEEEPFGRDQQQGGVQEYFLRKGEALGKRVAQLALKLKCID